MVVRVEDFIIIFYQANHIEQGGSKYQNHVPSIIHYGKRKQGGKSNYKALGGILPHSPNPIKLAGMCDPLGFGSLSSSQLIKVSSFTWAHYLVSSATIII
jgi:hypothetical protein